MTVCSRLWVTSLNTRNDGAFWKCECCNDAVLANGQDQYRGINSCVQSQTRMVVGASVVYRSMLAFCFRL